MFIRVKEIGPCQRRKAAGNALCGWLMTHGTDARKECTTSFELLGLGQVSGSDGSCSIRSAGFGPVTQQSAFLIRDDLRFRTVGNGHCLLEEAAAPAVPNPALDFVAVTKGNVVVKPVLKKRGLVVMTPNAFSHQDGQYVLRIGWSMNAVG